MIRIAVVVFILFSPWCNSFTSSQPTSDILIPTSVCIEESIQLQNNSTPDLTYEWDFCANDISQTPAISSTNIISGLSSSYGMDIVFDGSWFGLVSAFAHRFMFGGSTPMYRTWRG